MKRPTCRIEGCPHKVFVGELCAPHVRALGSQRTVCKYCGKPEYARGYCNIHYSDFLRNGPLLYKKMLPKAEKPNCRVPGCCRKATSIHTSKLPYPMCHKHTYRFRTYGDPLAPIHKPNQMGYDGEERVSQRIVQTGHKSRRSRYGENFDLLVDDIVKVEVKCCRRKKNSHGLSEWKFNIHRHGILKEEADLYILRLEKIPESKHSLHALFLAPLNRKGVGASIRSLLGDPSWHKAFADFEAFLKTKPADMGKWKRNSPQLCRCCGKTTEGMSYEEIGKHDWRTREGVKADSQLYEHLGVREA